jgi:hypothetical protein
MEGLEEISQYEMVKLDTKRHQEERREVAVN